MHKVWLHLFDKLIHIILMVALILMFLHTPLDKTKDDVKNKPEPFILKKLESKLTKFLESNGTMTIEDILRIGQECMQEEYYIENKYLTRTLEEGLEELGAKIGDPIFIRIFKKEAILEVWIRTDRVYEHLKDYAICAFSGYLGPKLKEGDRQAPEGFYKVKTHQLNPNSKFHLSFNLGYPNAYDRAHDRTGSFLMIHGDCVSDGCYAMTDEKITEIYTLVESALQQGQEYVQVHAFPFYMTQENMNFYEDTEWYDFWLNLKEGYDYFEAEKLPPHIEVSDKIYTIHETIE